jgi:uncharacterized damage-inducible protein DinB
MQTECQENLESIASLVEKLNQDQYQHPSYYLSGASIGQHIRHIIEFYTCLTQAFKKNRPVNYDQRKRSVVLEKDPIKAINEIVQLLNWLREDKILGEVSLIASYAASNDNLCTVPSSFQRELAYCLEHSIHHQALIKIGLFEQGLSNLIDQEFGVAPSTIKFRLQRSSESS